MEYKEFTDKIIKDLKLEFDEVRLDGKDRIYVAKGVTNVSVPIKPMYKEYLLYGYNNNLKNYIKIIRDILDTYKFKLDLSNVFPFIKLSEFGENIQKDFISEDLFCNLSLFWVSDEGEVFRFISREDIKNAKVDVNMLKTESFKNLNKVTNPLIQLEKTLEIYTLRFDTDYGATLFLSDNIQKQIKHKIGDDILFCIPSSSSLLCAKYRETTFQTYKHILQQLALTDKDINKISNKIYRRDSDGNYSIIA
ncbi:MAG: DUF1444 domain-containing protein [Sporanaerobacter sp.]|jgi:uncharacterized protein YtpQ (UPF0354 family)|uniref:DUF1444 family protein n=1 Tax=Sporanaerobacter sp. TaxID=2010183 RepID=UPI003A0FC6E8